MVESVLPHVPLPPGIVIKAWADSDFTSIQRLSSAEGWLTPQRRPDEALTAWRHSWPALVATEGGEVIGFLRALTDGAVTTYIAEVLVDRNWRGKGIGLALIETCHRLFPCTRLDLLSTESADAFYEAEGFRPFHGFRKSYL